MSAMQYPNQPYQPQPQPPQPEPPEPEYRFRWAIFIGIPAVILVFLWLLSGIEPSFAFSDIMEVFNVVNENAYVRLACLAAVLIAVTLIVKFLRRDRDH